MPRSLLKYSAVGLVVALALGFSTDRVYSEIEITGAQKSTPVHPPMTAEALTPNASLWVQCWQNGIKILDEDDIQGIRLSNLVDRDSVGFKGASSTDGQIHVIPVNDNSACLVGPMR